MIGREEFAVIAARTLEDYLATTPDDGLTRVVRMTSGTTGGGPLVFIREQPPTPLWFSDSERLVLCGGGLTFRLGWTLYFWDEDIPHPAQILLLDAADLASDIDGVLNDFAPDMLVGFPSAAARTAQELTDERGGDVRSVIMTGEFLRGSLARVFERHLANARLRMQYMIQEIGFLGSPLYCPHLPHNHYHLAPGVEVDIRDPDETGAGELLISATINRIVRIERYHYGDLARITKKPCACGATKTLEILGRSGYDLIRFAGAILHREEFDRLFALCAGIVADYRAEMTTVLEGGHEKARILLRIRPVGAYLSRKDKSELIRRYTEGLFLTPTRTLGDLVRDGLFVPLEIEEVQEPFSEKHKDIKLVYRAGTL